MIEMTNTDTAPASTRDPTRARIGWAAWPLNFLLALAILSVSIMARTFPASTHRSRQPEVGEVVATGAVAVGVFFDATDFRGSGVDDREEIGDDVAAAVVVDVGHLVDEVGAFALVELGDRLAIERGVLGVVEPGEVERSGRDQRLA